MSLHKLGATKMAPLQHFYQQMTFADFFFFFATLPSSSLDMDGQTNLGPHPNLFASVLVVLNCVIIALTVDKNRFIDLLIVIPWLMKIICFMWRACSLNIPILKSGWKIWSPVPYYTCSLGNHGINDYWKEIENGTNWIKSFSLFILFEYFFGASVCINSYFFKLHFSPHKITRLKLQAGFSKFFAREINDSVQL